MGHSDITNEAIHRPTILLQYNHVTTLRMCGQFVPDKRSSGVAWQCVWHMEMGVVWHGNGCGM